MNEDYWAKQCRGCSTIDEPHTNRECIEQVAVSVGIPLEQAKRQFGQPPPDERSAVTDWQRTDKMAGHNG